MTAFVQTSRISHDGTERLSLGYGSGFLVAGSDGFKLITNWHVLTGHDPITDIPTGSFAALPDQLAISFHGTQRSDGRLGRRTINAPLYDAGGRSLWHVHPMHGRHVDVVTLSLPPIPLGDDAMLMPYDPAEPVDPALISPTSDISIVGYPDVVRGRSDTAIWTRATVASEPDLDFDGLPCFLVDARGREGQSGSPVIGYWTPERMKVTQRMNVTVGGGGESWELFGIYSGRITDTSDLGRVWKRSAIREINSAGIRDDYQFF